MPIITEVITIAAMFFCLFNPAPEIQDIVKLDYELIKKNGQVITEEGDYYYFYARKVGEETIQKCRVYKQSIQIFTDDTGIYAFNAFKWRGKPYNSHSDEIKLTPEFSWCLGLGIK